MGSNLQPIRYDEKVYSNSIYRGVNTFSKSLSKTPRTKINGNKLIVSNLTVIVIN